MAKAHHLKRKVFVKPIDLRAVESQSWPENDGSPPVQIRKTHSLNVQDLQSDLLSSYVWPWRKSNEHRGKTIKMEE